MNRRAFIAMLGAAAWPLAAHGEPARGKVYRIGYLALAPEEDKSLMRPLLQRLRELGYAEGANMIFKYRSAEGQPERLAALASELVQDHPDVLIAGFGTLVAQAAKAATTTIPIVFTTVGDPLGAGIVSSLNRPGANVTGLTDQARDVQGKRLQLLLELVGDEHEIAVLLNPDTPFSRLSLEEAESAAHSRQIRLGVLEARTADQVVRRVEEAVQNKAAGLLIMEDPVIYSVRRTIAELTARFRLPAMYVYRDSAEVGGLMSYGPDRSHLYRRAAEYVDKILNGAKTADLAVEQPTRFEFIINAKAAKAIGIEIPPSLLTLADEVIE